MVIVRKKVFRDWNRGMRRRLRHATLPEGYMWKYANAKPDSLTFVVFSKRQVVGWSLIFSHRGLDQLNIFINPRYRGHGIARLLVRKALDVCETIIVAPWDKTSRAFYEDARGRHPDRIRVIDFWAVQPKHQKLIEAFRSQPPARP